MNLLNCMDMSLDEDALNEIEKMCCFSRNKVMYIKFESALRMMKFDNATEQWNIAHE
jgi:hypothetical protein